MAQAAVRVPGHPRCRIIRTARGHVIARAHQLVAIDRAGYGMVSKGAVDAAHGRDQYLATISNAAACTRLLARTDVPSPALCKQIVEISDRLLQAVAQRHRWRPAEALSGER